MAGGGYCVEYYAGDGDEDKQALAYPRVSRGHRWKGAVDKGAPIGRLPAGADFAADAEAAGVSR